MKKKLMKIITFNKARRIKIDRIRNFENKIKDLARG